ncbi:hypothetical protein BDW22DRAFT_1363924 [Trametopsis cervina]|nr:hypothetical protein BDW22DRAFT_1363924 [Trametopsis cervina]
MHSVNDLLLGIPPDSPPNIASLFPHVDEDTLNAILNHELPAAELYKLDTRRIMDSNWHLVDLEDSSVQFRTVPSAREIYQNMESLLVPLNTYFSILCIHGLSNGQPPILPCYFFRYSSHLVKIASQYEWSAVLLYHFAFFARRCNEMLLGRYSGWEKIDVDLMEELLVEHRKPAGVSDLSSSLPIDHSFLTRRPLQIRTVGDGSIMNKAGSPSDTFGVLSYGFIRCSDSYITM